MWNLISANKVCTDKYKEKVDTGKIKFIFYLFFYFIGTFKSYNKFNEC